MQPFIEQLQTIIPETSTIPMELFFTLSTLALNPVSFGGDQLVELNGDIQGLSLLLIRKMMKRREWTQATRYCVHYRH